MKFHRNPSGALTIPVLSQLNTNRSNTHADPLLDSRWAQIWVYMWVHILVILAVKCTKGNISSFVNAFQSTDSSIDHMFLSN